MAKLYNNFNQNKFNFLLCSFASIWQNIIVLAGLFT